MKRTYLFGCCWCNCDSTQRTISKANCTTPWNTLLDQLGYWKIQNLPRGFFHTRNGTYMAMDLWIYMTQILGPCPTNAVTPKQNSVAIFSLCRGMILISSLSFIQPGALRTPSRLWRGCRESWRKWRGSLHLLQHTDSNTKTASKWGSTSAFVFLQRVYSWHIVSYYGESSYCMHIDITLTLPDF